MCIQICLHPRPDSRQPAHPNRSELIISKYKTHQTSLKTIHVHVFCSFSATPNSKSVAQNSTDFPIFLWLKQFQKPNHPTIWAIPTLTYLKCELPTSYFLYPISLYIWLYDPSYMGVSINGVPNSWMFFWRKIRKLHGWWLGVPLARHQLVYRLVNYIYYQRLIFPISPVVEHTHKLIFPHIGLLS
jgi:hypothetical protein